MIIPIFVPHNGCPHDCIFCNQKKIAGTESSFDEAKVRDQIESYLSSSDGIGHIEIAFFGGSFTGIPIREQKQYLKLADEYVLNHSLDGIRLSTRPDMITESILEMLQKYSVIAIELGVQSMHQDVLDASFRGHTIKDVYKASKLIHHFGFQLGLQMMIGLPEDTVEKSIATADKLIAIDPDMVRIYPTLVVKDTKLESLYNEGLYEPFSLETTIDVCTTLLEHFEQAGINVLRIGLQTTDQIQLGRDVVAGPHHPALRQLVEEKRWVNYILNYSKKLTNPITIEASQKLYQTLIGHKRAHLPIWAEHEPVITVMLNEEIPSHTIKINETYHKEHAQVF